MTVKWLEQEKSTVEKNRTITFLTIVVLLTTVSLSSCVDIHKRSVLTSQEYMVFAWNDLGMHCLNPTYDKAVILPPYNTIWATVVKRGAPPSIVTKGIFVSYRLEKNTSSADKAEYGGFWDNAETLFGVSLAPDTGLNLKIPARHNGLSGEMVLYDDHFEAIGIPVVPENDSGIWNPYQVAVITAKDSDGNVLAETKATVPTSDEINCAKCHGNDPFVDIISRHDADNRTDLAGSTPFLCANCHGSPILGMTERGESGHFLSEVVHDFHAYKKAECYDCHPGNKTQCSRSLAHTTDDGNCTECHGTMAEVSKDIRNGNRTPWRDEPKCATCHNEVKYVDTGDTLYRDARGHGGLSCPACHGSPHAQIPSREASDNFQAITYQSIAVPMGSCRVCHPTSSGGGSDFEKKHAGKSPDEKTACNICHTEAHNEKPKWPHQFKF